jgi:hypothetical protein
MAYYFKYISILIFIYLFYPTLFFHLLPLRLPPKLVLLPLNALIFKVSFADGASPLEKASSADSVAKGRSIVLGEERRGSLLFKVILCFYNITKYIILYRFAAFIVIMNENTNHNK